MRIGIIGTRGIPNRYGGFEQFAEQFSTRLAVKGHEVTVYTSHNHTYNSTHYKNVRLVRCYDPEHLLGTTGQFIYDFNCIMNSRKQNFDVILQLGYTSSTIWSWLYPKAPVLVTNMDGLEWSRAKYNKLTQRFLTYAEKWGVVHSDQLISDSIGIQDYLLKKYGAASTYIPYAADVFEQRNDDINILEKFDLDNIIYDLVVARFEPENNIETILKAYGRLPNKKLVLVGDYLHTAFGRRLYKEYSTLSNINFLGPLFNTKQLNVLRHYSNLYLHGHSAGGTNPSLLEAMGCGALICAHDNIFNKHILGNDAFFFRNSSDLTSLLSSDVDVNNHTDWINNNRKKIATDYNWNVITDKIETCFKKWCKSGAYSKKVTPCSSTPIIKTYQPINDTH